MHRTSLWLAFRAYKHQGKALEQAWLHSTSQHEYTLPRTPTGNVPEASEIQLDTSIFQTRSGGSLCPH